MFCSGRLPGQKHGDEQPEGNHRAEPVRAGDPDSRGDAFAYAHDEMLRGECFHSHVGDAAADAGVGPGPAESGVHGQPCGGAQALFINDSK